ncbi:4a-hydroxytetrahydrobiopterin dehydratase [Streptomyces uncialis]|uniref:4a-hydroxytetrahydrobiopterin dehydratase n=1 Tax=Streptomyces uncialis TaxID=1048205 RepID=UPI0038025326
MIHDSIRLGAGGPVRHPTYRRAPHPLSSSELDQALGALPGWTAGDNGLTSAFTSARSALPALYAAVAAAEDEADHHADIRVLYGTVTFTLNTHDSGDAITARDTALASRITALAAEHGARPAERQGGSEAPRSGRSPIVGPAVGSCPWRIIRTGPGRPTTESSSCTHHCSRTGWRHSRSPGP